jgi:hypothetical protein
VPRSEENSSFDLDPETKSIVEAPPWMTPREKQELRTQLEGVVTEGIYVLVRDSGKV